MKSTITPPKPTDSGSYGNQEETQEYISADQQNIATMTDTIVGLASSNTKSFGNPAVSALIASFTSQLEQQLSKERIINDSLRERISNLQEEVSDLKVGQAVLSERLESFRSVRHIHNVAIFVGTSALAVGVELSKNNFLNYSYAAYVVGVILLISGWLVVPKGAKR